jgi:opacity protein-like surface antigen
MKKSFSLGAATGLMLGLGIVGINSAQAAPPSTTMYIEGTLGRATIQDVDTNTYSGTSDGITFTDLRGTLDYNEPTYWGLEFGAYNLIDAPVRLGISINTLRAKFQSATISGSLSDGTTTYTGPISLTRSDLTDIGLDLDSRINLYSLNGYYDFPTGSAWRPYLGFGIGWADIKSAQDEEFMYSLHAGVNYDINPRVYIGARVGWYHIEGPTDKTGIRFDSVKTTTVGATLGYRF